MGLMDGLFVGVVGRVGGEGDGGRKALTWRECVCFSTLLFGRVVLIEIQVLHYMEKEFEPQTHSHPSWSLLTNEAKADVVRREEFDPYIKDKSWTCGHCSVHYLAPVVRKGAIYHCKAAYVPFFSL